MEPVITPLLLASSGVNIPDEQLSAFLDYLNELLEERVGETVIDVLNEEQVIALAELQETASDEEVQAWIQANVPDLGQIVQDEMEIILGDANEYKDQINL